MVDTVWTTDSTPFRISYRICSDLSGATSSENRSMRTTRRVHIESPPVSALASVSVGTAPRKLPGVAACRRVVGLKMPRFAVGAAPMNCRVFLRRSRRRRWRRLRELLDCAAVMTPTEDRA